MKCDFNSLNELINANQLRQRSRSYNVPFSQNSLNELINVNQLRPRSRSYIIPFSQNNITRYKEKNDKQMIIKECDFWKKGIWKKKKIGI